MGFQLPDGKTARNIQEQVKFLTEKLRDLYARVNDLELHIEVVDALPDEGVEGTIYLVPVEDPESENYYEEYLWIDDAWELIGTTQIDLSDYVTLSTNQTITGEKTLTLPQKLKFGNYEYKFDDANFGQLYLGRSANLTSGIILDGGTLIAQNIAAQGNNLYDIGGSSQKFKDLYLSGIVYAGTLKNNGTISLDTNASGGIVRPSQTNTDLGDRSHTWKDVWFGNAQHSRTWRISPSEWGSLRFVDSSGATYMDIYLSSGQKRVSGGIDGDVDLGNASYRWKNLYLSGNISDGTNSISIADIGKKLYLHTLALEIPGGNGDIYCSFLSPTSSEIDSLAGIAAEGMRLRAGHAYLEDANRQPQTQLVMYNGIVGGNQIEFYNFAEDQVELFTPVDITDTVSVMN